MDHQTADTNIFLWKNFDHSPEKSSHDMQQVNNYDSLVADAILLDLYHENTLIVKLKSAPWTAFSRMLV